MLLSSSLITLALITSNAFALPRANPGEELAQLEERSQLEPRATVKVITTCKNRKDFAMTFDDGPAAYGPGIARYFESKGLRTTFFMNGYNWQCIYDNAEEVQARYKAGHVIAAHTWGHVHIPSLTPAQLNKQIDLLETAFMKILGIRPKLFRAPYGELTEEAAKIIRGRNYTIVGWSFDSGDSGGVAPAQSVKNYQTLTRNFPASQIALNHESYEGTAKTIVPQVVPMLIKKGYTLVTVDKCLGIQPYQFIGKASKRDSSWTCDGKPLPGKAN